MKSSTAGLVTALQNNDTLAAKARVIAEWNQNRYAPILDIDNFGYPEDTYGSDLEIFPIDSISAPVRPTAGILKGRAGEGVATSGYDDNPATFRTYTADPDSKYKYWSSPKQSGTAPNQLGGYTIANVQPYIKYSQASWMNKVYVCFESSWSAPVAYDIQVATDSSYTWTTIASNIAPDSKGRVQVWRQNNGSYSTTPNYDNPTSIWGLRLVVKSMARKYAHLNLIELSPRLERDLTAFLIDYNVENSLSEPDFISPMGTISANTGSVTLSNTGAEFNNDNPGSIYYGLIDANVKFTIDLGLSALGSPAEYIRLGQMYSGAWEGDEEKVSVPLQDGSKFLQEVVPNPTLIRDCSIGQIVWRLLDASGFNNYQYSKAADDDTNIVPFFWTNGDVTLWDVIQEIARTTQTAVYFDEFGVIQIKTRNAAFNTANTPAWTFDYNKNGSKQPDILELQTGTNFEANKVTITYKPTTVSQDEEGNPIREVLWQPEGTVVLRASNLVRDMTATQMHIIIDSNAAKVWPYEGMINLRGELMKYKGKQYVYFGWDGIARVKNIYTDDELRHVDVALTSPAFRWRNYWNGILVLTERGYDDTEAVAHDPNLSEWKNRGGYVGSHGGAQTKTNSGIQHYQNLGLMRLHASASWPSNYWYCVYRGDTNDSTPLGYFGTRLRFPSSPKGGEQSAGIFFYGAGGNRDDMYAVDITSTAKMDLGGRRTTGNEVRIFKRKGGVITQIGGKGYGTLVVDNKWLDVDITVQGYTIAVNINGVPILTGTDTSNQVTPSGRHGIYVRGYTVADFEYYYAADYNSIQSSSVDNSSYRDIIRGSYYSNQYYKDAMYGSRTWKKRRGKKPVRVKKGLRIFDEFGVIAHEVRPYTVKFEKAPALSSQLFMMNDYQAVIDEYVPNAFKASFVIANANRDNAVISGDDSLTFGADNVVNQQFMVIGQTIQQGEEKDYVVKSDQAIRARGEIPLQISSDWIQSEGAAKALGDWIVNNWSEPADEVSIEIVANPLLQIGDIVSVNYPLKNMAASTHKYFVVTITNDWSDGPGSTVQLRRARI